MMVVSLGVMTFASTTEVKSKIEKIDDKTVEVYVYGEKESTIIEIYDKISGRLVTKDKITVKKSFKRTYKFIDDREYVIKVLVTKQEGKFERIIK